MRLFRPVLFAIILLFPLSALADTTAEQVMHATYKLVCGDAASTCFLVENKDSPGNPFLVTAAHAFKGSKGDHAVLILRAKGVSGTYRKHEQRIAIREGGVECWRAHPKHDVAVLRLAEEPAVRFAALPLSSIAREADFKLKGITVGSDLTIFTYPRRFEAGEAAFPIGRRGMISSFPLSPVSEYPTFMVDFTTFDGDSGAPLFVHGGGGAADPVIVGLVAAQYRTDESMKMLNEERVIHHPLAIAQVVHSQFIREVVDDLVAGEVDDAAKEEDSDPVQNPATSQPSR